MPWYVLYTKPRNEKKTAQLLEAKSIEVYCPLHETIRQWSDRKKKVTEPLFRSYIFVKLSEYEKEQVAVLTTPGAVRFLWWLGKPGVVRDEEIQAIQDFLNRFRGSRIEVTFQPGDDLKITSGPLKDKSGKLIELRGSRAILQLRSLGWNVMAEFRLANLTASDDEGAEF